MGEILKSKEIVLLRFPFSDQSGAKRRPALIISKDKFNSNSQELVVCAITSNIDSLDPYSVLIRKEDWKAGTYSESCVKCSLILTVHKGLILKKIGRLDAKRFREVTEQVHGII